MPWFRCSSEGDARIIRWTGTFTVGRGGENDLVLADRLVSRNHARVRQVDDGCLVEDLRSRNGTYLEHGHDVSRVSAAAPRPLTYGDAIRIGSARLVLEREPPSNVTMPTMPAVISAELSTRSAPNTPTVGPKPTKEGRVLPVIIDLRPEAREASPDAGGGALKAARRRIAELEGKVAELQAEIAKAGGQTEPPMKVKSGDELAKQ